jgi:NAD(P)H-dependent FMN reductase
MTTPKILVFPGSNRSGSINARLAAVVAKELALTGADVTRISLADYALPLFSEDLEREKGIPENAFKLARLFASHHGIVIVTPEYNSSLPPLLKNTLDWISRVSKDGGKPLLPYRGNVFALAASSPGGLGGIRVLPHLRDILVSIGAQVITEQLALGNAGKAYDEGENLLGEQPQALLKGLCSSLIDHSARYRRP